MCYTVRFQMEFVVPHKKRSACNKGDPSITILQSSRVTRSVRSPLVLRLMCNCAPGSTSIVYNGRCLRWSTTVYPSPRMPGKEFRCLLRWRYHERHERRNLSSEPARYEGGFRMTSDPGEAGDFIRATDSVGQGYSVFGIPRRIEESSTLGRKNNFYDYIVSRARASLEAEKHVNTNRSLRASFFSHSPGTIIKYLATASESEGKSTINSTSTTRHTPPCTLNTQ